jgi:hypothetical protein
LTVAWPDEVVELISWRPGRLVTMAKREGFNAEGDGVAIGGAEPLG